ncbi:MAG: aminopeptidase [Desulfovibrionaceae bacterium]|nr:aminopeptidase [Desulfovibrionaceae bacterium]MDD4951807.1 aminopeptidase [Desulfovibrionaceae bacterium]
MFNREELEKYARTLWWGLTTARTRGFSEGDLVLIRYDLDALPLAETVWRMLLDKGLNLVQRLNLTSPMELAFYSKCGRKQLEHVPAGEKELFENLNGLISLIAPASLTHLSDVDPKRIGIAAVARKFLRDIMEKREQAGVFGWTLCAYPTPALAQASGMGLDEYAAQIKAACFLDQDDPPATWREVFDQARAVKTWLNSLAIDTLRVESKSTDLWVAPGDMRRWLGVSGHNIPSFEIFLSPDWRRTRGVYFANQPSYRSGNLVRGVRLEFREGRVTEARAEQGQEFLNKQIKMDPGACRLGEFSLTDRRFSRIDAFMANTLFDENFGGRFGNCHVALGASYPDTYSGDQAEITAERKKELGFNDSALHWDLVNTEPKVVTAALKGGGSLVIYRDGEFQH